MSQNFSTFCNWSQGPLQAEVSMPDRQPEHSTADCTHGVQQHSTMQNPALQLPAIRPMLDTSDPSSTFDKQLDTCTASAAAIQQLQLQLMQHHEQNQQPEQPMVNQDSQKANNRERQKTFRARQKVLQARASGCKNTQAFMLHVCLRLVCLHVCYMLHTQTYIFMQRSQACDVSQQYSVSHILCQVTVDMHACTVLSPHSLHN